MGMTPGIAKYEFAMGAHGLQWKPENTEITKVSCRARLLGIQPGWSISMVNGVTVAQGYEAGNELLKCKKLGRKYQVYFMKDEQSIRADQAKAEQERIKKAKEREERERREASERKI